MGTLLLLILAIGLAMDSVAVSVALGIIIERFKLKTMLRISFMMGIFQGGMFLIGWYLGLGFKGIIEDYDHWVAFVILTLLGGRMIFEHFSTSDENTNNLNPERLQTIIWLALATSIDALAVGVSFGLVDVSLITATVVIGIVSFLLSYIAIWLTIRIKHKLNLPFELIGGIILITIGLKILLEHTGIL